MPRVLVSALRLRFFENVLKLEHRQYQKGCRVKALKYTFVIASVWSGQLYGSDISDIEFKRAAYPHHYEMSDIFGIAKLIKSLMENSDDLKKLLQNPADVLRATLLVGGIAAMVKVSSHAVQGLSARIPEWTASACRRFASWCMRMLNLPEGFDYEQLVMCEQMFEQIMAVWCSQGALNSSEQAAIRIAHWDYQRHFVQDMLHYLIGFLESHQQYYRAMQIKRGKIMTTHIGDNRVDHVCFLVQSIIGSLRHMAVVCERAENSSDFDVEHVKKVARATVILLKKLCAIIGGESIQSYNQTEYNFGGQSFMPASGLFDV